MTSKTRQLTERLTIDPDDTSLLQRSTPPAPALPTDERPSETSRPPQPDSKAVTSALRHTNKSHNGEKEAMPTALDDPALLAGRKAYRSFYVDDLAFGRFRAAVYWVARRPDAAGEVPENMSVAINDAMIDLATKLEQQFNDGKTFPPTPEQRKSKRTKSS